VLVFVLASFALALSRAPFGQDQSYHAFADSRSALGIPNFGDVASNLIFVIAGLAGLWVCFIKHPGKLRNSWIVMFAGIASVGVASAYYHWNPNDQTLVWDRATLTIGFMGLFVAILGEYIDARLVVQGHVMLKPSGAGRTLPVLSPAPEATSSLSSRIPVTLSGIHLNGLLYAAGAITLERETRMYGALITAGTVATGSSAPMLEVWYNPDFGKGFFRGLPVVYRAPGTWQVKY